MMCTSLYCMTITGQHALTLDIMNTGSFVAGLRWLSHSFSITFFLCPTWLDWTESMVSSCSSCLFCTMPLQLITSCMLAVVMLHSGAIWKLWKCILADTSSKAVKVVIWAGNGKWQHLIARPVKHYWRQTTTAESGSFILSEKNMFDVKTWLIPQYVLLISITAPLSQLSASCPHLLLNWFMHDVFLLVLL